MIGLIGNLEFVCDEIVLKVIRRDVVIRFNSLTFAWTALSGFRSTEKPFFSQVFLSGFQLARCTIFFVSLIFAWIALSGFRSTGKPFFAQVTLSGFQLAGCTDFFCFIPNFCWNRPFEFSIHRDAHFFPSRPFGFSTCRVIHA